MTTNAIRLSSPHELLAVVPYVLGFRPTSSIMVLCLTDHRLGLIQRLDLPTPKHAHRVASALMPSLVTENPDSVIVIGFEDHEGEAVPAIEALSKALVGHDVQIHDRILVRDGRWLSMDCHSPDCCPPQGSPVPEPAEVSRVVAEFVGQGVSPHPDRTFLARQLEPGPEAVAVGDLLRRPEQERSKDGDRAVLPRAERFAAWPRILKPDATSITGQDACLAAMSLLDIEFRDGLVAWLCPGTLDLKDLSEDIQKLLCGLESALDMHHTNPASTEAQNAIQGGLIRLCSMLPDSDAAPALSVLATFVWWLGDGALARVALARAFRCDPGYRLALLLEQMVDLAIRPGNH